MIKVVIKVIVQRKSMVINRGNITMKRIINQISFKKQMIIARMIDLLSDQENLSMIGKLKKKSKLEMINLLMIGMRNILTTVGKEAIVVIVTIQMININMDQHL